MADHRLAVISMVMNFFMESGHFLSSCIAVVFNGGFCFVGFVIKSDRQLH